MADSSDSSTQPVHDYTMGGTEPINHQFSWTSHSFMGATYNDGKSDAFNKVKEGLDPGGLRTKADGWYNVHAHIQDASTRITKAYNDTFSAWSGDDADRAEQTFGHARDSAVNMEGYSRQMRDGTKQISDAVAKATGVSADGPSGLDKVGNAALGLNVFGSGDGDADVSAYETMIADIDAGRSTMPASTQWQVKGGAPVTPQTKYGGNKSATGGVSGVGTPGAGGSAQHVNTPNTAHITDPGMTHQNQTHPNTNLTHPNSTNTDGPKPVDDTGYTPYTPTTASTSATGTHGFNSGYTGGTHVPHLDGSSTLASAGGGSGLGGYDGTGGAGAGIGGGGVGGLGSGAGLSGVGSAGGGASLAGAGLGGGGLGAGGAGAEGAGAAAAGAAGGRSGGSPGMMPMRGGGAGGGGDDERERNTWLTEEDDVWGDEEATPSVIS